MNGFDAAGGIAMLMTVKFTAKNSRLKLPTYNISQWQEPEPKSCFINRNRCDTVKIMSEELKGKLKDGTIQK